MVFNRGYELKVFDEIKKSIDSSLFSQSSLFYGPIGSLRLTTALDASYLLLNKEGRNRLSDPSKIAYLPSRDFTYEVKGALSLYRKARTASSKDFLLESIRKALLQYDAAFSGIYNKDINSLFDRARDVSELLYDFEDESDDNEIDRILNELERLLSDDLLFKGKRRREISVDEVRRGGRALELGDLRVLILENVEDSTDSSKNSLLKLLEEPPRDSYIILISQNPQKLLETLLSRLRKYSFTPLTKEEVNRSLQYRFSLTKEYESFNDFLIREALSEGEIKEIGESLLLFRDILLKRRRLTAEDEERIYTSVTKTSLNYFLSLSITLLESILKDTNSDYKNAYKAYRNIKSFRDSNNDYNLSDRATIDLILREAL